MQSFVSVEGLPGQKHQAFLWARLIRVDSKLHPHACPSFSTIFPFQLHCQSVCSHKILALSKCLQPQGWCTVKMSATTGSVYWILVDVSFTKFSHVRPAACVCICNHYCSTVLRDCLWFISLCVSFAVGVCIHCISYLALVYYWCWTLAGGACVCRILTWCLVSAVSTCIKLAQFEKKGKATELAFTR